MKVRTGQFGLIFFGIVWLSTIVFGLERLLVHQTTPGKTKIVALQWPAQSRLPRIPGRATLVMIAHPKCPCTRASLGELARIMAQCEGKLKACVLFLKPAHLPDDWEDTELRRSASVMPGVTVRSDEGGIETGYFGAVTSGHTFLYDTEGRLQFSGGITASRGHFGDNAGHSAIVSLVTTGRAESTRTPVFGCSLGDPAGRP